MAAQRTFFAALAAALLISASAQSSVLDLLRQNTCNVVAPGPVRGLIAIGAIEKIDLVWLVPSNHPCNVVYEVSVWVAPRGTGAAPIAVVNVPQPRASLAELVVGTTYEILVTVSYEGARDLSSYFSLPQGDKHISTPPSLPS